MASDMDRAKAVDLGHYTDRAASFGKGSSCGWAAMKRSAMSRHPHRFTGARSGPGYRRRAEGTGHRDLRSESGGKTTLALHIVAEAQKQGGLCRFYRRRTCPGRDLCEKDRVNTTICSSRSPIRGSSRWKIAENPRCAAARCDVLVVDSVRPSSLRRSWKGNGRRPDGTSGKAHVPGPAQADGKHQPCPKPRWFSSSASYEKSAYSSVVPKRPRAETP